MPKIIESKSSNISVPHLITRGLKGEALKNREAEYRNAIHILMVIAARIKTKLDHAIEESEQKELHELSDNTGWHDDNRGYRRAHREFLKLLPNPDLVIIEEEEKENG